MKMGYLHAIAALALAGYVYQVSKAGRATELYALVQDDLQGFLTQGLALAVVLWVLGKVGGPVGLGLGALIVVTVALNSGPKIIEGVNLLLGKPAPVAQEMRG